MRILVIRRDNIGDLVCTTPLFAALRARFPHAYIAALVNSYNAGVLDGNPHLDEVLAYTKLKHRLPGQSRAGIVLDRVRMMLRLRRQPFDYVVLAKAGFDRQGLGIARQLRRRAVVGYPPPGGARPAALTLAAPGQPDPGRHEVEVMEALAAPMGILEARGPLRVYPDAARVAAWRARLPALAAQPRPLWIAAHISAREPSRQWASARWVELIRTLAASGAGVVLLWSPGPADDPRHPGDDAKAREILAHLEGERVAAAATAELADLVAVLSLCDAFIGADGGAMHLAAACALPTVALFENLESKKRRWYPWGVPHELVAPTTQDIGDIAVGQVEQAWRRLASGSLRRA